MLTRAPTNVEQHAAAICGTSPELPDEAAIDEVRVRGSVGVKQIAVRGPAWARWPIGFLAVLLIMATLIPLIESQRWWVRVFIFPQAQFTILLALVAAAIPFTFAMAKIGPKVLLLAVCACLVYQSSYLLPYTPLWASQAQSADSCPAGERVSILALNVREGNEDEQPVIDLVQELKPDLFLAVETDRHWARALSPLEDDFQHVVSAVRDNPWGLTLYSRLPLASPEVRYLVEDYVPSIKTGVQLRSGARFNFYGLHPKPPLMHSSARGEAEIIRAGREISVSDEPAVLSGDLNDVPWGDAAQRFQKISGMVDPRVGRAFDATYKADNPFMRWPLDHTYFTPDFRLLLFEPLHDVGSDHFPLLTELCLTGAPDRAAVSQSAERKEPAT